jgi:hypothetical protein
LSKVQRKPTRTRPSQALPRNTAHLKKEEADRLNALRAKLVAARANDRPDVDSTLELMYLRILGRVRSRAPVEAELKKLKTLLDQAASTMNKILDETEGKSGSK